MEHRSRIFARESHRTASGIKHRMGISIPIGGCIVAGRLVLRVDRTFSVEIHGRLQVPPPAQYGPWIPLRPMKDDAGRGSPEPDPRRAKQFSQADRGPLCGTCCHPGLDRSPLGPARNWLGESLVTPPKTPTPAEHARHGVGRSRERSRRKSRTCPTSRSRRSPSNSWSSCGDGRLIVATASIARLFSAWGGLSSFRS